MGKERTELWRLAEQQLEAQRLTAIEAIDRVDAEIQTGIIEAGLTSEHAHALLKSLPTIEAPMPPVKVKALSQMLREEQLQTKSWETHKVTYAPQDVEADTDE